MDITDFLASWYYQAPSLGGPLLVFFIQVVAVAGRCVSVYVDAL